MSSESESGSRAGAASAAEPLVAFFDLGVDPTRVAPDDMRRIRILSIATVGMVGVALIWCVRHLQLGVPTLSAALLGTVLAALGNLYVLRRTLRPTLASHIALALLGTMLCFSSFATGGFFDPNFSWVYLVPICAAVVLDLRGAAIWTGLTVAITVGFWLLPQAGVSVESVIPQDQRPNLALFSRVTAILAMGLVGSAFVIGQRRAERELGRANAELFRETAYVQLLSHAAVSANEAPSFERAMQDAVVRICQTMGWEAGHIYVISEEGALVSSGFHHLSDDERFGALRDYSLSAVFWPGEGFPGRAYSTGKPQCISDLDRYTSPNDRPRIAREAGLRSAYTVPIKAHGEVRAVLEFGASQVAPRAERLIEVFTLIATQLGRVAERMALQDRLRRSQKLEAVGQLAAGLAHEINNPMSYVRSNLHVLREEWDALRAKRSTRGAASSGSDPVEDIQELIDDSLEGVDRTISIVKDVREFAHFGQAGGDAGGEWVDLAELVEGAIRVASPRSQPGVQIDRCLAEGARAWCNPGQLRQVLVNLVVNALQAVGEQGHVRLTTGAEGGGVFVRVEDDGPGMASEIRERLFDPFFTTKPVGEGTGLGLYVSYEIVRTHGGEIVVQSEPGVGTSFEVRLPDRGAPPS